MSNIPAHSFRPRGTRRLLAILAAACLIGAASPAAAATISPTDFTITAPAFSGTSTVQVSGNRDDGSSVQVLPQSGSGAPVCDLAGSPGVTTWSCLVTLQNGPGQVITARETLGADDVTATTTVGVLAPPSIDSTPGRATTGLVEGSGYPGSNVSASLNGSGSGECSSTVTGAGYWSCSLALASGDWTIRATQSRGDLGTSALSGPATISIDKDAPGPPSITSPRSGSRVTTGTVRMGGEGEDGASLDVYVDNSLACSTTVQAGGGWECTVAGITRGQHSARAIQRDGAGNFSDPGPSISLDFTVNPDPPAPDSSSPPGPTPTPTPDNGTLPPVPYDSGASPPGPPATTNWGTPTPFGTGLPTMSTAGWSFSPLVALGYLMLVGIPLLLLLDVIRDRPRRAAMRFTGRNRAPEKVQETDEERPPLNPWITGALPFAAAVGVVMLAGGFTDEPRYVRLTAAVAIGLAVLNVVGVAVATRLGSRLLGVSGRLRFIPLLLLAAAIAAVLSRVTGIEPPVIAGVLIGVGFLRTVPARAAALVNLIELAALVGLGILGWVAHDSIGPSTGFWQAFASEITATVAFAGLGSALVLVLPLGRMPGRAIFAWSRVAWAVTLLAVATLASAAFLGGPDGRFPVVASLVVAVGFAALALATWSWIRFVQPALRD